MILDPFQGLKKALSQFKSLNHLKHHLKNGSFSLVSAQKHQNPDEDAKNTAALQSDLDQIGATYHHAKGKYRLQEGPNKGQMVNENSFLVHHSGNVSPSSIAELGKKYGQESVLHWNKNKGELHSISGAPSAYFSGHSLGHSQFGSTKPVELSNKSRFHFTGFSFDKSERSHRVYSIPTLEGDHEVTLLSV